ncbi:MAG: hypothetical protein IPN76_26330 [Saprospiraceae bacterium]|nr:hypothetical protein [Saprospiraceae bacterium]
MVWEQNTAEFPTDLMELVKLAIANKLPSKISKKVHKNLLYFSNRHMVKASEGATSVEASITVSGQFIFYRPQPNAAAGAISLNRLATMTVTIFSVQAESNQNR